MQMKYIDIYLEKAREIGFRPSDTSSKGGKQEAARYCLVNGLIPFTPENVALTGARDWYIRAEHIPEELQEKFLAMAKAEKGAWTRVDEYSTNVTKVLSTKLEGIHIDDGRLQDIKVQVNSLAEISEGYYTPEMDKEIFGSVEEIGA